MVTFSIPLQIHPCRASVDAVLRWRPGKNNRPSTSGSSSSSTSGNQPLLPSSNQLTTLDSHGAPIVAMSELRFALITSGILILSYITALNVSSLDRVLAYVGSTGSTAISFILPGLFYYKISDPDSIHHQRLTKEDDDADYSSDSNSTESNDPEIGPSTGGGGVLEASISSLHSATSMVSSVTSRWRAAQAKRRKGAFRWDLEHIEHGFLRQMALALAIYGVVVMVVCLVSNTFLVPAGH